MVGSSKFLEIINSMGIIEVKSGKEFVPCWIFKNQRRCAACRAGIPDQKAELFGSYANGTNRPDSDVDLLLEFQSPRISLLTLSAIKYRLEDILKTDVDVIHGPLTPDSMIVIDRKVPLYESQYRNSVYN